MCDHDHLSQQQKPVQSKKSALYNPIFPGFLAISQSETLLFSQQVNVFLQRVFHFLAGDPDISLGYSDGTVLQQLLDQDNIVVVVLVDFCCEELPEGMGAYVLVAQIVRNLLQVLLDGPLRDREHDIILADVVLQAIDLHKLVDHEGDREGSLLLRLFLDDVQTVTGAVFDDIAQAQFENVFDPQSQVRLQDQARCDPVVRPESGAALAHCRYDFCILFLCQSNRCFVRH